MYPPPVGAPHSNWGDICSALAMSLETHLTQSKIGVYRGNYGVCKARGVSKVLSVVCGVITLQPGYLGPRRRVFKQSHTLSKTPYTLVLCIQGIYMELWGVQMWAPPYVDVNEDNSSFIEVGWVYSVGGYTSPCNMDIQIRGAGYSCKQSPSPLCTQFYSRALTLRRCTVLFRCKVIILYC